VMKIPHNTIQQPADINITEEMNKSGCWKSLDPQHSTEKSGSESLKRRQKERKMSLVKEEAKEDSEEAVGLIMKNWSSKPKEKSEKEVEDGEVDGETGVNSDLWTKPLAIQLLNIMCSV